MKKFVFIVFWFLFVPMGAFILGSDVSPGVEPCETDPPNQPEPTDLNPTLFFNATLVNGGRTVNNLFSHCGQWYGGNRNGGLQWAYSKPGELVNTFPQLEYVTLHSMTGGSPKLDLYAKTNDPHGGMDFTMFNLELDRVLAQGVKPYIKVATVPHCLSDGEDSDKASVFEGNKKTPGTHEQWTLYYEYVKAIAQNTVDTYSLETARSWQWGCFSEANNIHWLDMGSRDKTEEAFFKLYDFTVAALQSVLGKDQFDMGTHLMGSFPISSDMITFSEESFIEHCVNGKNYYTGETGTQLNFIAISRYNDAPGKPESLIPFAKIAENILNKASAVGLNVRLGVDEYGTIDDHVGNVLSGSRTVGMPWQTSKTGAHFVEMLLAGYDYLSTWSLTSSWNYCHLNTTKCSLSGARLAQGNVGQLASMMEGSVLQTTEKTGESAVKDNEVQAVISYNDATNTTFVFLYNHNSSLTAEDSEVIAITLGNIVAAGGETVNVKRYVLDATHSNWWEIWWKERGESILAKENGYDRPELFSPYDVIFPNYLGLQEDRDYWNANVERYAILSQIATPQRYSLIPVDNTLTIQTVLPHHSVVLYEISNTAMAK